LLCVGSGNFWFFKNITGDKPAEQGDNHLTAEEAETGNGKIVVEKPEMVFLKKIRI